MQAARSAGFTLVELLVALGLMAILLTMIAQIFFQASQSFRIARASVESHRNARAALDVMQRDFACARLVSYGPVTGAAAGTAAYSGWFRYGLIDDPESAGAVPALAQVPSITFTTVAGQGGVRSAYPSQDSQVALVRYTLEWTGTQTKLINESTGLPGPEQPVYTLVKKVRLPNLQDRDLNMTEWNAAVGSGTVLSTTGANGITGQSLLPAGFGGLWANNWLALKRYSVRITSGTGKGQVRQIVASTDTPSLTVSEDFAPLPQTDDSFEIIPTVTSEPLAFNVLTMSVRTYQLSGVGLPGWEERPLPSDTPAPAAWYVLDYNPVPYMVEITLKMADQHIIKINTFTARFYLPASVE